MGFRRAAGQDSRRASLGVLSAVVVVVLLFFAAGLAGLASDATAATYEPPTAYDEPTPSGKTCPAAPEPLAEPPPPSEGEESEPDPDPLRRELRLQRIEAVEICEALAADGREVQARLWWLVAEQLRATHVADVTLEELSMQLPAVNGNLESINTHLLEEGGGGAFDGAELVDSIDASGEASVGGLYFVAGLIVALFIGYAFWRTVIHAT